MLGDNKAFKIASFEDESDVNLQYSDYFAGLEGFAKSSEFDIQDSFKLIFVICVLLLVMYTCGRTHSKIHHEWRHNHKTYENERTDSETREGSVHEKSLATAEEREVKKKRVRKKKPRKQIQENGEVSRDIGKERERASENGGDDGAQAKYGKSRKKTPQRGGPELESAIKRGAKNLEIPKVPLPVERDEKFVKRRNKFVVGDGADQDGDVTKHTEKSREDVDSNKVVEQIKDGKWRNRKITSKHVDESRKDSVKSRTVDEVRDMDNLDRKMGFIDKKEHGVKPDTRENVDAVNEIREVKSAVNSFSSSLFENRVGSVCAVDDKTSRKGRKLAGKPRKLLQAHHGEDFLEKDFINNAGKETWLLDEVQRQAHPDSQAEREWAGNVHRTDYDKRRRDDGRWDSGGLFYRARPQKFEDVGPQAMNPSKENREFVQGVVFGDNSDTQLKTQIEISSQKNKFGSSSSRQNPQITSEKHFVIDPEVRKRIAHPKHPVRVPDRPLDNLDLNDPRRREYLNYTPGRNVSRVNGLFGRKWEEMMDRKQEKEFIEDDLKVEDESVAFIHDCPTFMIWGTCHRGQRCELRHPSYRYLDRPKRAPPSPAPEPEPVHEEPKPPNSRSYAAILEKTKSSENADFFNVALFKGGSNEASLEEEWPALGSLEKGKASKSRTLKSTIQNELKVQEPKKVDRTGPVGSMTGQAQIASDQLIAETLQVNEYAEFNDFNYDDCFYAAGQSQELNEDNYYPEQVENTLEDDENSFDTSEQGGKTVHVEQLNSFNFNPLIIESSDRAEEPSQTELSTTCDICMDRPKDATLICGHRFCYQCALQMRADERVCAICRRCIVSVIKTFN